jgi:hypothetical protein
MHICTYTISKLRYGAGVGPDISDLRIFGNWFFGISAMKFLDHLWNITKIGDRFLSPFTNIVSLPLNKIFQFSLNDSRIKDF